MDAQNNYAVQYSENKCMDAGTEGAIETGSWSLSMLKFNNFVRVWGHQPMNDPCQLYFRSCTTAKELERLA